MSFLTAYIFKQKVSHQTCMSSISMGERDELVPVGDETLHLGLQGLGGSSLLYLKNFDAYCNGVCSHAGLIHLKRSGPQDLKLDLVLL